MPGLVPGIHVLIRNKQDVDGRGKPGHDEETDHLRAFTNAGFCPDDPGE